MNPAAHQRMLVLCLATVYFVWGTSYIATRVGVLELPPLLFGGARFVVAGLLLTAIALWRGFRPRDLAGHWHHLLVMSLIGVAICNGLHVWAMQWVPSNAGALLNASSALWIVVFGLFGARGHRPAARAIAGLAIGFAGTVLLMWPASGGSALAGTTLLPPLAILAGCMVWSLGTIYMRNFSLQLDLFALIGVQMLAGGLWMTLAGFAFGEAARWHWSGTGMVAMAYLIVFSSGFAYMAYGWLARHATPAQVGTYSYVNPAIAAVLGFLVLDETLSVVQCVGAAVILAGVLMINWPVRAARQPPVRD